MSRFARCLDRLLPHELAQAADRSALHRGRALAAILLLTSANGAIGALVLFVHACVDPANASWTLLCVAIGLLLFFGFCQWLLKRFGAIRTAALASAMFITLSTALLIAYTGGLHRSPIATYLFVQPFVIFLVLGRKAGLTLGLVTIALGFLLAHPLADRGYILTAAMEPAVASLWPGPFMAILVCFWYLDHINRRLTAAIAHERDVAQFAAGHDPLSGLLNRTTFEARLEVSVAKADLQGIPVTLLLVDLDGFKAVNDTCGHAAGDHVITVMAARLREAVRQGDSVARLGGDEFALLLEGEIADAALERITGTLLRKLAAPITHDGRTLQVSGSIGGACCPADAEDLPLLMRCADAALYRAKANGKNTVAWFADIPR